MDYFLIGLSWSECGLFHSFSIKELSARKSIRDRCLKDSLSSYHTFLTFYRLKGDDMRKGSGLVSDDVLIDDGCCNHSSSHCDTTATTARNIIKKRGV
jgi:hypothetical protein